MTDKTIDGFEWLTQLPAVRDIRQWAICDTAAGAPWAVLEAEDEIEAVLRACEVEEVVKTEIKMRDHWTVRPFNDSEPVRCAFFSDDYFDIRKLPSDSEH